MKLNFVGLNGSVIELINSGLRRSSALLTFSWNPIQINHIKKTNNTTTNQFRHEEFNIEKPVIQIYIFLEWFAFLVYPDDTWSGHRRVPYSSIAEVLHQTGNHEKCIENHWTLAGRKNIEKYYFTLLALFNVDLAFTDKIKSAGEYWNVVNNFMLRRLDNSAIWNMKFTRKDRNSALDMDGTKTRMHT